MLDTLYKKLRILFIVSIMLIITMIIGIVGMNDVKSERMNHSSYIQRLTTLLIYQLEEDPSQNTMIQMYEQEYQMYCLLKDQKNTTLYESKSSFPTKEVVLLEQFNNQVSRQSAQDFVSSITTTQGGLFEITGSSNDSYWAIPAEIITKDEQLYELTLIYPQNSTLSLWLNKLPFYSFLWFTSLIAVVILAHFLLKKAFKPTALVLKSQKEFVASASHELKSPLAVMLANIELLKSSEEQHVQLQTSLKTMDVECMRMSKLISDMLLLASSDAKTWTLHLSDVNVDSLLVSFYEAFTPLCEKNKIALSLDLAKESYPILHTDQERCFQILSIFIDNAIAHAKNSASIEIQSTVKNNSITFSIVDHGDGIQDDQKPLIFNRFYCGDSSHSKKSHFGLGLSIAKELAVMLHAFVGCYDTVGGGTTFYVTLPLHNR